MTKSFRVRKGDLIWFLIINLVLFQNALMRLFSPFRFFDEVLTLFFLLIILQHSRRIRKIHGYVFLLLILLLSLGIIGNTRSGIRQSFHVIVLDMLYFSKLYICMIGSIIFFEKKGSPWRITHVLAIEVHSITILGLFLAVVSQFVDLGMTRDIRHGIKSFMFLYSNPGSLSQYCMAFLLILTIDLRDKRNRPGQYLFITLLFLLWLSTGRTRGLITMAIWCFIWLLTGSPVFRNDNAGNMRKKIRQLMNPGYLVIALIVAALIGWDQFQHYFGPEATSARSYLLRGSMAVMRDYFPWGAGFATYGTEMAARYYSPLYIRYGLYLHWALVEGGSELTDCFWPAVGAEFGIFGIIITVWLVAVFSKLLVRQTNGNRYELISALTYLLYLYISSTGSSVFTSYSTTGFVVMFIALVTRKPKHER